MNEKAIFEIGDLIHIRYKFVGLFKRKKMTAKEIIKSIEYQREFKPFYPELCRLAEKSLSTFDKSKGT